MSRYISVVYDESERPYTEYPAKLCNYIAQIFQLKPGMKLLEPGCGRGDFIKAFQQIGLDVTGVDICSESLNYATDYDVAICDVEQDKLPFEDDFFDVIYSKSFIEHLHSPEKYLAEAYRVLKPGGILITLVPDWESNYKTYFDDFTHRTPFTIVSLKDAYKIFGFDEINVFKFRQLPIVWRYPFLNYFCAFISPFIPVRVKNKFLRWSRELMLVGVGYKSKDR
ncbi:class I SAM-dependent methyltransferase [Algibacillus agarilyticus]|uniref:class I SAM-dependent methyltransferase n=1 Tax=Algibacillus agarilyticus TaxID=2234133 RepID=UPI000DCFA5BE|nr:class I SAM-dependent methyltransferase [Algibacillus agarilyticus]